MKKIREIKKLNQFSLAELCSTHNSICLQESEAYKEVEVEHLDDPALITENSKKHFFENTATDIAGIGQLEKNQSLIDRITKLENEITSIVSRLDQLELVKQEEVKRQYLESP